MAHLVLFFGAHGGKTVRVFNLISSSGLGKKKDYPSETPRTSFNSYYATEAKRGGPLPWNREEAKLFQKFVPDVYPA